MAQAPPGWCEQCGAELQHSSRTQGRARRYCDDACRQASNRQVRLRRELTREIGLTPQQVTRLIGLFRVTPRTSSKS
jgi:hypothetical protein